MKKVFTSKCHIHKAPLPSVLLGVQSDTDERALQVSALESFVMHNRSFEKPLLEAVDEVFSSLGDSAKQAIYFSLAKTFNINKQDIPYKIEEFADAVEKIFGLGGKLLEIQIMEHLYEKVGHSFEYIPKKDVLAFTDYVDAARKPPAGNP